MLEHNDAVLTIAGILGLLFAIVIVALAPSWKQDEDDKTKFARLSYIVGSGFLLVAVLLAAIALILANNATKLAPA